MTLFYAGIGSRDTPCDVLLLMSMIGSYMAKTGFTLRSGGATGADSFFESGCDREGGAKEIYLPWNGFNGYKVDLVSVFGGVSNEALCLASQFHPAWHRCTHAARTLHARNCYQILGRNLDNPVKLVLCWTPGARGEGGTGQAIRIARHYNIPVHDLADPLVRQDIETGLTN